MSYRGRVRNGVVEFDSSDTPPDGTSVEIRIVSSATDEQEAQLLADELLKIAGSVKGLPTDFARNHDHYIHGQPKQ